jgi:hypothetical protein
LSWFLPCSRDSFGADFFRRVVEDQFGVLAAVVLFVLDVGKGFRAFSVRMMTLVIARRKAPWQSMCP